MMFRSSSRRLGGECLHLVSGVATLLMMMMMMMITVLPLRIKSLTAAAATGQLLSYPTRVSSSSSGGRSHVGRELDNPSPISALLRSSARNCASRSSSILFSSSPCCTTFAPFIRPCLFLGPRTTTTTRTFTSTVISSRRKTTTHITGSYSDHHENNNNNYSGPYMIRGRGESSSTRPIPFHTTPADEMPIHQHHHRIFPMNRRAWIYQQTAAAATSWSTACGMKAHAIMSDSSASSSCSAAPGTETASSSASSTFCSIGYGRPEYTNALVASRDTNISPAEAYDVLRQHLVPLTEDARGGERRPEAWAMDVGAGAGVSTQILYQEAGYHNLVALDWSGKAWRDYVVQQPSTVHFLEMSDDAFFQSLWPPPPSSVESSSTPPWPDRFDCIVYNFAINRAKAVRVAQQFLTQDTHSRLLAPCNDVPDYWYKQSYLLLNQQGHVLWQSTPDLGAWAIQFQPDVTSPTCTGIWCGAFNGYQQKR